MALRQRSRRKFPGPLGQNLLILTIAIGVALIVIEIAVRILSLSIPQGDSWAPHDRLGWTDLPDRQYHHQVEGRPVTVESNKLGFRDTEHSREKPAGIRRIAIIGDSFVAATQVNLSEAFPKRLEALFNDRDSSTSWEVLSFGVGDWGNAQQLIALEDLVLDYRPDLIVWQLFPLNDICNNEKSLAFHCKSLNDGYRPYLATDNGGRMTYLQPWRRSLRQYWRTFAYLDRWQLMMRHYRFGLGLEEKEIIPGPDGPVSALLATYMPHERQPAPVQQGWQTTERLIERFVSVTREAGVPLGVIMIPFVARLGESWESFLRGTGLAHMERGYADQRLLEILIRNGVSAAALRPCFEIQLERVLPYVDGHLSASGHAVAAECIWEFLETSGLLEQASR